MLRLIAKCAYIEPTIRATPICSWSSQIDGYKNATVTHVLQLLNRINIVHTIHCWSIAERNVEYVKSNLYTLCLRQDRAAWHLTAIVCSCSKMYLCVTTHWWNYCTHQSIFFVIAPPHPAMQKYTQQSCECCELHHFAATRRDVAGVHSFTDTTNNVLSNGFVHNGKGTLASKTSSPKRAVCCEPQTWCRKTVGIESVGLHRIH